MHHSLSDGAFRRQAGRHARLVVLVATLLAAGPSAAAPPASEVHVLIDVSGSMKANDPSNARAPALRLLTRLLPTGTRAGVWTFARRVNALVPPGTVDDEWRRRGERAVPAIHSRGLFTDIEAAIDEATRGWRTADESARRSLILLTDGMVDLEKGDAESERSRRRILDELEPRLDAAGVVVHTIALSERADHALMRRLAARTGGWYEQIETTEGLQRIFLKMFEKATEPDTLPIRGNRFQVDAGIREMTVLVFRAPGTPPARLVPPDGETFGSDDKRDGVRWAGDAGYDLVTVTDPPPGEWQILAALDPDNRVLVVTDLRLEVDGLPSYLNPDETPTVRARITEQDAIIRREDFLRLVEMRVERAGGHGQAERWTPADGGQNGDQNAADGIFSVTLDRPLGEGVHELVVTADGGTFVRELRRTIRSEWPVSLAVSPGDPDGVHVVSLVARPALVDPRTLEATVVLAGGDGQSAEIPVEPREDGSWQARIAAPPAPERASVSATVQVRSAFGEPMRLALGPVPLVAVLEPPGPPANPAPDPQPGPAPAPRASWLVVAAIVALVNLVGGIGGWLGWRWMSRRQARADLALAEDTG